MTPMRSFSWRATVRSAEVRKLYILTDDSDPEWDGAPVFVLERKIGMGKGYTSIAHAVTGKTTLAHPEDVKPARPGMAKAMAELFEIRHDVAQFLALSAKLNKSSARFRD